MKRKNLRRGMAVCLATLLVVSLVPSVALAAVSGNEATTSDAPAVDSPTIPVEQGDSASSWRYQDGALLNFSDDERADEAMAQSEADEAVPYATITPHPGVTFPSNVVTPPNATGVGIDVSVHNGTIDWAKVKAAGVNFAIIRCGYGKNLTSQDDKQWKRNVSECERLGIPYGVYLYSYAISVDRAKDEAEHVLRLLKDCGNNLKYPVYFDLEESAYEYAKQAPLLSEMAFAFCSIISEAGYTPGVYANTNWFNNFLTEPVFDAWPRWVAQYNRVCEYKKGSNTNGVYQMWQCTSSGEVDGIDGNKGKVDLNYVLGNTNGKLASASGLQMVEGKLYLREENGANKTGWQNYGNRTYYFGGNGAAVVGNQTIDGTTYSFNLAGALEGVWVKSGGAWYLHNQNGANKTGWQRVQGEWYYLDSSTGAMKTGWQKIGTRWYYFKGSGAMLTGWLTDGGKQYYLQPVTGIMLTGKQTIDGKTYTFDSSGALQVSSGSSSAGASWVQNGGKWYLKNASGENLTGWQKMKGSWYYLAPNGVMATGWQQVDGVWYYLKSSGAMATGWQKLGGKWYYLNGSGIMATGWQKVGGSWYYLRDSGAMATGWQKVSGTWYYLKSSGAMAAGWQKVGGAWYYLKSSGAMAVGWQKVGGSWYYLKGSGAMATGWQQIGGTWYHLRSSGAMSANCWVGNYYLTGSGAMATNTWIGKYHVDEAGRWDATR